MKVGVAIMVKDEAPIITRCLQSILSLADEVIITDTGSTDATIFTAGMYLQEHNIKFKIYRENFVDFGFNRTLLLQRASQSDVDYTLMLDADEILMYDGAANIGNGNDLKLQLHGSGYNIRMDAGNTRYFLPRLLDNKQHWQYTGVTHEFLETKGRVLETLNGAIILQINDSRRRKNFEKYAQDIELLKAVLSKTPADPNAPRYTFYLAESYYGAGQIKEAIETYERRTFMGGWKEEVFYSFYQLGNIYAETTNTEKVIRNYLLANETNPQRAEPIAKLKAYLLKNNFMTSHNKLFDVSLPIPLDGLFIDTTCYEQPTIYRPT